MPVSGLRTSRLRRAAAGVAGAGAAAYLAGLLSACTMSDDSMSRFLAAPDKYVLYTCPEIVEALRAKLEDERKLQGLMARAAQGTGGEAIGDIAYRPDYLAAHGEEIYLRQAAAAKNCPDIPAVAAPAGVSSDAVR
jgi:hypothetical protein